jgi:hypothetical protein
MIIGCPQDYDGWRTGIDDWTRLFLDVEPDLDRDLCGPASSNAHD